MYKNIIYLFILMLSACGQSPDQGQPVTVDPVLAPYMQSFESNIGVNAGGISAKFADTENDPNPLGEVVGECVSYTNGTKIIQFDSVYWSNITEDQRIQLVYHELGHCAMGLRHTPGYITNANTFINNCPISIMNPYAFGGYIGCFTNNESYYFDEFKSLLH